MSAPLRPAARTWTRISPAPGSGSGCSSTRSSPSRMVAARMGRNLPAGPSGSRPARPRARAPRAARRAMHVPYKSCRSRPFAPRGGATTMGNHSGAARPSSAHATTAAPLPITLPPGMAATDDEHIDSIQHELAVLARRAERIRVAALGRTESTLDRSAYLLLGRLETDGPQGIRALAGAFRLDVSTVTRQVAPLERARLVERVPDPRGGRGSAIRLPAEGARQLADVRH